MLVHLKELITSSGSGLPPSPAPDPPDPARPSVIVPLVSAALLGAAGAVAWIYGSNLVLGTEGTLVQFSGAVVSGLVGGPAGLLITEASHNDALGAILGGLITGVVYTVITSQVPQTLTDEPKGTTT